MDSTHSPFEVKFNTKKDLAAFTILDHKPLEFIWLVSFNLDSIKDLIFMAIFHQTSLGELKSWRSDFQDMCLFLHF